MLILFDIDGTLLLRAAAEHRAALHDAIAQVWGVDADVGRDVAAAGRTDLEIAREILLQAGVTRHVEDRWDDYRAAAVQAYAQRCPEDLTDRVAPGVVELLAKLDADGEHTVSLVTGNLEPIARIKLRAAGIGRSFGDGQGGYGSDHEDRAMLPAIARRRAAAVAGREGDWPRDDTVVIGDTPRDIACAHADGIRCIAVATGPYTEQELGAADVVISSAPHVAGALTDLTK